MPDHVVKLHAYGASKSDRFGYALYIFSYFGFGKITRAVDDARLSLRKVFLNLSIVDTKAESMLCIANTSSLNDFFNGF